MLEDVYEDFGGKMGCGRTGVRMWVRGKEVEARVPLRGRGDDGVGGGEES